MIWVPLELLKSSSRTGPYTLRMARNVIAETAIGLLNQIMWYAVTAREQGEANSQVM